MLGSSPANATCAQGRDVGSPSILPGNAEHCAATVIDRFTTSFNWPEVNFGSVWLRPYWYVFLNSAITDQLSGGLGFVGGGSWPQVPPGFFDLTKDSIFAGTTRSTGANSPGPDSQLGPVIDAALCASGSACLFKEDGTALFLGGFAPKRMMTIYDGPFYAEGSIFTNTPEFTSCDGGSYTSCGVYKATTQPAVNGSTESNMLIPNAGIGWKQPNGFYYPPAFAFLRSAFDDTSQRHNVIDQYKRYFNGSPAEGGNPAPPASQAGPLFPNDDFGGVTPIDFSTILNDLDGTLTGMEVVDAQGAFLRARTSSVSENRFFDAPAQDTECESFGVQTSAYDFSTTVMSKLRDNGGSSFAGDGPWFQDFCSGDSCESSSAWNRNAFTDPNGEGQINDGGIPAIPIYRQYVMSSDAMTAAPRSARRTGPGLAIAAVS